MTLMVFILIAYLLGSIPFAVITSRVFRLPDPRTFGSKNPGATNMLRSGNKVAAVLTLLGDAGKGLLVVILAKHFAPTWGIDDDAIAIMALAVFFGHIWSVFLYFRGGRGVATALGVAIGLNLWTGLLAIVTWLIVAAIWRISSLSALVAAVLTPVYAWIFLGFETASTLVIFIMSLLLIWRHKSNIAKLISGKEARIGKSGTP